MPCRKQLRLSAQVTILYPALVDELQRNPLFADCDFSTLELTAFVKKAPPYIKDIDTPITNLER